MQIVARCPKCGSARALNGAAAGRRIRCSTCGGLFKVPRLEEVPKAMKVIREAKGPLFVDEDGRTYG